MATEVLAGEVNAISSKYKWVISNFSTCCENIGDSVISPKFMVRSISGGVRWHLILYPRGKTEANKNYLSLYLYANAEIKAVACFEILNDKGQVIATHTASDKVFCNTSYETFAYPAWEYYNFAKRDFFMNPSNGILNDDKLTITCKIALPDAHEEEEADKNSISEEEEEEEDDTDDILHRLEEFDKYEVLINDDEFSDVSLISEGKVVKVHKCILSKSSSVFAAIFKADVKNQVNMVEISDVRHDVLLEMIRFVYTGKVNNIDSIAGELVVVAHKYALAGLMAMCEKTICKNLSADNAVECLVLADRYRLDKLKKRTIEFSVAHADDVIEKPEFQSLPSNVMYEICRAMAKNSKQ